MTVEAISDDLRRAEKSRFDTLAAYNRQRAGEGPYFPSNGSLIAYERAEAARKHRDQVEEKNAWVNSLDGKKWDTVALSILERAPAEVKDRQP